MSTREKLLQLFETHKGIYISGEEIARQLQISRAAVWKAVKNLRESGYQIDAVPNKGYCLSARTDILSSQGVEKYLEHDWKLQMEVLQTVDSTNAYVRRLAENGAEEGFLAAAGSQTAGRGRYTRTFYSPSGTGLYFSLLLRPHHWSAERSVSLTTMAAVAMCQAVEAVTGVSPRIQWVNDIFVNGKKVCGILTEGALDLETAMLRYAVLGVGVNVYRPADGFPEELKEIAGAVSDVPVDDLKNRLMAEFLNRFFSFYRDGKPYQDQYRNYSMVIGRQVTVISSDGQRSALVLGIDDNCRLQVRYNSGENAVLSSGEIRIQMK